MSRKTEVNIGKLAVENSTVTSTTKTTCQITGNLIERAKPHLRLFDKITSSFEAIEEKNLSDTRLISITDTYKVDIKRPCSLKECDFCNIETNNIIDLNKKRLKRENRKIVSICEECWEGFFTKIEKGIDSLKNRYIFHDNSGILITDYNEKEEFEDYLTRNKKKSKNIILIGCEDVGSCVVKVGLSNIEKLVRLLDNPEKHDSSEIDTIYSCCDICGKTSEAGCHIKSIHIDGHHPKFCRKCTKEVHKTLRNYIKQNEELILSRKI